MALPSLLRRRSRRTVVVVAALVFAVRHRTAARHEEPSACVRRSHSVLHR
eukprot:CAMPEP_0203816908 /NCGR_PEP_ID=MMETSP0115-20131106/18223_1 /ASSEMBLY_ACC=CAM_ASM_000227 /TAXON_ID=33651 /ORGANISM="Bicosoecid sp, Strain ms1" /LENGTH=49 /DNA_ID= /DNA_START= /DNA_END= /DNA_ORIENTATION=